jgi:hypothetical protein
MVRGLLEEAAYENRSKKREQDFSRERKMPFKKLIRFMLGMVKESSQNALERFFPKIKEGGAYEPTGIQHGAAKNKTGNLSGNISGKRGGEL